MDKLNQINVFGLNEYDLQRILRENINALGKENSDMLSFVRSQSLPTPMKLGLVQQVQSNAAEVLYILSISSNQTDLQTYINTSPLFRGGAS